LDPLQVEKCVADQLVHNCLDRVSFVSWDLRHHTVNAIENIFEEGGPCQQFPFDAVLELEKITQHVPRHEAERRVALQVVSGLGESNTKVECGSEFRLKLTEPRGRVDDAPEFEHRLLSTVVLLSVIHQKKVETSDQALSNKLVQVVEIEPDVELRPESAPPTRCVVGYWLATTMKNRLEVLDAGGAHLHVLPCGHEHRQVFSALHEFLAHSSKEM
jgi:hypothetical protein